jgi:ATP-binding cassette subfamily F protein uup
MNIISLAGVSKTLGDAPLFEQVTLGIDAGEKIGFIGRNGSGKSTFLRILNGEIEPDTGSVSRNRELTLSALEQTPQFASETTIDEFLFEGRVPPTGRDAEEESGILSTFRSFCRELGLADGAAAMGTLSGGMVRKVSLARCLAFGAGFLTLDEPTNHLDLDTIEWLESLLMNADWGFLLVTHDRYFLDAVCTAILEIDGRRVYKYPGNYSEYLERKAERAEALERAEQRRTSILRGELDWLKRGPRARTGKDKGRKERIQDLLDAGLQKENALRQFSSTHRRLGRKVLELQGIAKSYGGKEVIRPFTYSFRRGERIGIIGPNGSGKTTFLNLVSQAVIPDRGTVIKGETTLFASFSQREGFSNGKLSVLEYVKELGERVPVEQGASVSAEQFLERFLFSREMQALPLERLSGGEFRRLYFTRLLATAPNFLLLDEPTNDLDLDTIRLLENYLLDFSGCMMIVSHDRAMLDRLTDYLFIFDGNGGIRGFTGNYEEYRDARAEENAQARAEEKALVDRAAARGERQRPVRQEKSQLSFKERQEYGALLEEITSLEGEQRELESEFQRPVQDAAAVGRRHSRYREVLAQLERKMARWQELAERAGG